MQIRRRKFITLRKDKMKYSVGSHNEIFTERKTESDQGKGGREAYKERPTWRGNEWR